MASNVSEALRWAIERLAAHGSPRAEAEELLGRLLDLRRADLYLEPDFEIAPHEWERFEQWVARRAAGEPLQYITGRAAFRDLDLTVDPRVLVPRPETEGLVEAVLEALRADSARWPAPRVLDLGTGSGAVALSLAHECPQARVTATDASVGALEVARDNARRLGLEGRVTFLAGAWFDAVGDDDRFEAVVSNPPYVAAHEWPALPADVRREPHGALVGGESGLDDLRVIVEEAPRHLVAGGVLALELAEQRAAEVAAWFEGAYDWREAQLLSDLAGRPRVLIARRADGPAIAPAQWGEDPPGGA
jgi:release factor glutamine methyltransferase